MSQDIQTNYQQLKDEAKVNNIFQSEYEQTTDGGSQIISEKQISLEQNGDLLKIQQIIQMYRDRKIIKYLFLIGIFSSGLMFYNNNFQGILKEYILEDTGIDQQQFQLFQTLSTGPIIPLILFSGAVNDILGLRNGMSFYFFMMAIGMWIATIGGYNNSFIYLLIGKILNNAGIEMGIGARSSITAKWFKGGDLAFYNSIYLTITKFTQFSASLLYTRIYEHYDSLFQPILIGAIIGTTCFLVNLCSFFTDLNADRQIMKLEELEPKKHVKSFSLKDLKEFDLFYWTIILAFGINFGIYYPFVGNSTTIYKDKFNLTSKNTGDIQSINYFMGLFCPLIGFLIKKFKSFQFGLLIIASCCSLLFFCILYFHPGCEETCFDQLIVPVLIFGLFIMAFPVILVPAVANASPLKVGGTAYGIAYAFKNFTEAIIPYIGVGPLLQNYTVDATIMLFIGLSVFSLAISITIHIWFKRIQNRKQQK